MLMVHSRRILIVGILLVVLVAAGGTALWLSRGSATDQILAPGASWTATVIQDAGAVTRDGSGGTSRLTFRFTAGAAPKVKNGSWIVRVRQDGAEGIAADGWVLTYRTRGSALVLDRVALAGERAEPASMASVVLGLGFPVEQRYTTKPRNRTYTMDQLLSRSAPVPDRAPAGTDSGVTDGAPLPPELPSTDDGTPPR